MKTETHGWPGISSTDAAEDRCTVDAATLVDSSMAKLWLSELEFRLADQCLQFSAAWGTPTRRRFADLDDMLVCTDCWLGVSEFHRLAIGRML